MNRRTRIATVLLVMQAGAASAADLPPASLGRHAGHFEDARLSEARVVPNCEDGDDALVLKCGPVVVLPNLDGPLGERVVEASPLRRKPYRQVFSWGD